MRDGQEQWRFRDGVPLGPNSLFSPLTKTGFGAGRAKKAMRDVGSPKTKASNHLSACKVLIINTQPLGKISGLCQLMASLTGLPMRPSISTSVSMVNFAVFLFTTSDTRGRDTIRISAASACFK